MGELSNRHNDPFPCVHRRLFLFGTRKTNYRDNFRGRISPTCNATTNTRYQLNFCYALVHRRHRHRSYRWMSQNQYVAVDCSDSSYRWTLMVCSDHFAQLHLWLHLVIQLTRVNHLVCENVDSRYVFRSQKRPDRKQSVLRLLRRRVWKRSISMSRDAHSSVTHSTIIFVFCSSKIEKRWLKSINQNKAICSLPYRAYRNKTYHLWPPECYRKNYLKPDSQPDILRTNHSNWSKCID